MSQDGILAHVFYLLQLLSQLRQFTHWHPPLIAWSTSSMSFGDRLERLMTSTGLTKNDFASTFAFAFTISPSLGKDFTAQELRRHQNNNINSETRLLRDIDWSKLLSSYHQANEFESAC